MTAKPFLKWAGGKTQLLQEIQKHIPFKENDTFVFVEPFVGSGAVLFQVLQHFSNIKQVVINDINSDLINCYETIKSNPSGLIKLLLDLELLYNSHPFQSEERKAIYYSNRALFNSRTKNSTEQAALFIFLNRTCFNGLYRVNKKNEFNVPQGSYKNPTICNAKNIYAVSEALQKVKIMNGDFSNTIEFAGPHSFFYFDPPYKPLSKTSHFTSYAIDDFDDNEQVRLKDFCEVIDRKGSKWLLSNSDVKGFNPNNNFFDELFEKYKVNRVKAKRRINSDSKKRGEITELLITNPAEA